MEANIENFRSAVSLLAARYGCEIEDCTSFKDDGEPPCITVFDAPKKLHEKLAVLSEAFYGVDTTAPLFGDCDVMTARSFLPSVNSGRFAAAMAR